MDENDVHAALGRLVDGQAIRLKLASGRTFDGVYDGAQSSFEDGLYFESNDGRELRADWENIEDLGFRSSRVVAGNMMVPPEHPLSGVQNNRVSSTGVPLKPHTSRNS